mgnify:CR=1 FL=1
MFKKALVTAAALSTLLLGASAANAGYSISIGYGGGYGGGYHHHHNHFPVCFTDTRAVTIRVWDEYAYRYVWRTVYRPQQVCF